MSRSRKDVQRKEANNFNVCTEWTQEWMSPKRIQENNIFDVQEVVRGPFSSPRLLTAQPYISYSSCQRQTKYVKNNCNIRHGIPDTWREYLAVKGIYGTTESCVLQKHLIPSCVRYVATERLWNNIGLPFIQGIPDPWKSKSLHQSRPIKCSRRRCFPRRKNISTQYVYDGDDESEIEYGVKCPFNKDYVDGKKDAFQTGHRESNFLPIQSKVPQMHEDNLKEIERTKPVSQLPHKKNIQLIFDGNRNKKILKKDFSANVELEKTVRKTWESVVDRNVRKHSHSKAAIHKQVKLNERKQSLSKKREKTSNEKVVKKNIQTVPIETVNEAVQTSIVMENRAKQIETPPYKSHAKENIQRYPKVVCCNCMLQNYASPNIRYCSNFASPLKAASLSNRVLCQECEDIYCKTSTKKLRPVPKTISYCTSDPKKFLKHRKICKWTKLKLCTCMRKSRKPVEKSTCVDHCVERKSTNVSNQELKLFCYHCNSSYVKIASICANDAGRKSCSRISEKPLNKSEKERNRIRDRVTKYSTTRRRQSVIRGSKKCECTCVENKRHISKRGLEQTSHSTTFKWRNDVAKRCDREFLGENNYDNRFKKETQIEGIQLKDIQNPGIQGTLKNVDRCTRLLTDCQTLEKKYGRGYKRNEDKICCNEEFNVTQFPSLKSDKIMWHSVSDSGNYADISDSVVNVGFNVTAQDKFSVTSLTFIQRLNNTTLVKNLHRTKKLRRNYVSSTDDLDKHALNIGNERTCTIPNYYPSRICNNIFRSTVAEKGKAVISSGTSIGAKKSRRDKATLKYRII